MCGAGRGTLKPLSVKFLADNDALAADGHAHARRIARLDRQAVAARRQQTCHRAIVGLSITPPPLSAVTQRAPARGPPTATRHLTTVALTIQLHLRTPSYPFLAQPRRYEPTADRSITPASPLLAVVPRSGRAHEAASISGD